MYVLVFDVTTSTDRIVFHQFLYFGGWSLLFTHSRPFEPLFRDPWWVFTVCNLFWNIKTKYDFGIVELIRVSPRFGILLGAMVMSLVFMVVDILSVTHAIPSHGLPDGINPFWKFSYIFKCLTDTIVRTSRVLATPKKDTALTSLTLYEQVLDDFKTALDRLAQYKLERSGSVFSDGIRGSFNDVEDAREKRQDKQRAFSTDFQSPGNLALQRVQMNRTGSKVGDWTDMNELAMIDLEHAQHIDDITQPSRSSVAARPRRDSITYP